MYTLVSAFRLRNVSGRALMRADTVFSQGRIPIAYRAEQDPPKRLGIDNRDTYRYLRAIWRACLPDLRTRGHPAGAV
ncbi:hypothetical protein GCM10009077_07200 [Roseibium denhamense]